MDAKLEAQAAEAKATAAKDEAEEAREKALAAEAKAEYDAYISRIGLAATKIDENAFDRARDLLKECPEDLRGWEWGRLAYLCSLGDSHDVGQPIEAVAVASDGKRFAVAGWGETVRIWNAESDKPRIIKTGGQSTDGQDSACVFALSFSPDGEQFAVGTNDRTNDGSNYLRIYSSGEGRLVGSLGGHRDAVVSVAYSKDGKQILTGSYDSTARLYNLENGGDPETLEHESIVWSAAISADGQRIITGTEDGTVGIWSPTAGKRGFTGKREFLEHLGPVYAVAQSPNGDLVASGGRDQRILLWNPKDVPMVDLGALVDDVSVSPPDYHVLEGHTDAVRSLQFSDDGRLLVSSGDDNTVRVWDVKSRRLVKTLRGHGGRVPACAFLPGGDFVLSVGHDRLAILWNLPEYREIRFFGGHDDAIFDATFSQDGTEVVTASRDRTAII